tara:strand:- start:7467 stop:9416 length:1950 start_codon:yes stop_codon:yes gene_type:complete
MRNIFFILLFLSYASIVSANQDRHFIAAWKAFRAGDSKQLAMNASRLKGHILEYYVDYYQIQLYLDKAKSDRKTQINATVVINFLTRYQGSFLADKIRSEWLKILGESEQWELFAKEYPALIKEDDELRCYSLQQQLHINDSGVFNDALPLWLRGKDLPESCIKLFDSFAAIKVLTEEDVWKRIRIVIEKGRVDAIKISNKYLSRKYALNEHRLDAANKNPLRYLVRYGKKIRTRADHEIALFAMLRLLRKNLNQAHMFWPKIRKQFSHKEQSYVKAKLATRAAYKHDSRALTWFMEAANGRVPALLSDMQLGWRTRAALRAMNWSVVLESIQAMSLLEQKDAVWRYWKARALKEQGGLEEAQAILLLLSKEHHFYGQLAREELGIIGEVFPKSYKISEEEIAAIKKLPGIQRTIALYHLDFRIEATREWIWTIRKFNDKRLLAVSEMARRNNFYDIAINTANKTKGLHNFSLRYLAPYRSIVKKCLKNSNIDEALIYGLIRQESRFVEKAKSRAGAIGLMQLMPSTAKWIAKKSGMRNYSKGLVSRIDTNLMLGTYYLEYVLNLFDNQLVLASAAYNAGPSRAKKWQSDKSLEGAIYIETIPFKETRNYVKKVMSNSVYYANILKHKSRSLKNQLGIIAPRLSKKKET